MTLEILQIFKADRLVGEGGFEADFGSNDRLPIQDAGHENVGPERVSSSSD